MLLCMVHLFRFAKMCSNLSDFNNRNQFLTTNLLLKQSYRCNKLRRAFSKFYRKHSELIVNKYNVGVKTLLQQGILEPVI